MKPQDRLAKYPILELARRGEPLLNDSGKTPSTRTYFANLGVSLTQWIHESRSRDWSSSNATDRRTCETFRTPDDSVLLSCDKLNMSCLLGIEACGAVDFLDPPELELNRQKLILLAMTGLTTRWTSTLDRSRSGCRWVSSDSPLYWHQSNAFALVCHA